MQKQTIVNVFLKSLSTCFLFFFIIANASYYLSAEEIKFSVNPSKELISEDNLSVEFFTELSPNKIRNEYQFTFTLYGRLLPGLHIYSIHTQGEFAPIPTQIVFEPGNFELLSTLKESPPKLKYDDAFENNLEVHTDEFWLQQQIQINNQLKPGTYYLSGFLLYQICNNKICSLPIKDPFQTPFEIN